MRRNAIAIGLVLLTACTARDAAQKGDGARTRLQLCTGPGECAAGLDCREMTLGGNRRCTATCTSDSQCPAGQRCQGAGGAMACLDSDVGRPCADAGDCNFDCLLGPDYCTAACAAGADCPSGFGCMDFGAPTGRACVRASAPCDGGTSACVSPVACDASPALLVAGCTLACADAGDCPRRAASLSAWTCDGVCRRPSDVHGPLPGGTSPALYYCDSTSAVVNLCGDALHLDLDQLTIPAPPAFACGAVDATPGVTGDACVDSCRVQGGCPFAYSCVAVGDLSGVRAGLCLPGGAGEIGAACLQHSDCAFGYCLASTGRCSRDCTVDGLCPGSGTCAAGGAPDVDGQVFRRCE